MVFAESAACANCEPAGNKEYGCRNEPGEGCGTEGRKTGKEEESKVGQSFLIMVFGDR